MMPFAVVGSIFGGYVIASVAFLRWPHLLHTPKPVHEKMWRCGHISHRGGAAERLENTMEAFQHAMDIGTDMLELDVHLTRDHKVVVAHDGSLVRIAGVEGTIADRDYASLPPLQGELAVSFDDGTTTTGTDRKIPLFEDVLKAFPTVALSVDVKADDDRLVAAVGALIRAHRRESITMWGSFWPKVCGKCAADSPTIGRFASVWKVVGIYGMYYTGLLPFCPLSESYFAVPFPQAIRPAVAKRPATMRVLHWLMCAPGLYRHLQARGIPVYVWVINDEDVVRQAFEAGVNGVMTDRPTMLRDFLDRHPEFPQPAFRLS